MITDGSASQGAFFADVANLEENSPNARCWLFSRIRPKQATSQNAVAPPLPSTTWCPSGRSKSDARPSRTRPTVSLTGACRCEVPISDGAGRGEGVEVAGLDLGRAGAEAAVGGQQVGGDLGCVGHGQPSVVGWWCVTTLSARPILTSVQRIDRVGFGHRDAPAADRGVQEEYVARYGGRDATPLDPLMFEPPAGSFYVGYVDDVPVVSGAWRRRDDIEVVRHHRGRRDQADVRRPGGARPGAGPRHAGPPRARPRPRPARG